ncbi:DNA primase [Lactobacillaceae bacterium L1_55_11]|nr:DNA primase [Lactobacillaceae bacterium L1_55_11]
MAQRIPQAFIDEVRQKVNIVDVIGQYTQLVKRGRQWNGSCPFHEDRHPSLFVNEEKQVFHCFSCGRSGTVFSFIMDKEGLTYPQAILNLAESAGLSVDPSYENAGRSQADQRFQAVYQLHTDAQRLYQHILLHTTAGEQALRYLTGERQLEPAVIEEYGIGFAPTDNALWRYAQEQKVDSKVIDTSNLFIKNEAGQDRDRFGGRVVWPIKNENGQVVGFSGRSLDPDNRIKYMNSPESPFFDKGKLLYSLDLAKSSIRQARTAMIFEGFMDVISANMAGDHLGVATMGTALTQDHVRRLSKMADRILLAYDGDEAGQNATKRSIELIRERAPQLEIGIISLPDNLDPDEMRRERGLPALKKALEQGILTPVEFLVNQARSGKNLSNQAQYLDFLREVMPVLKAAGPVEQDAQLSQLSAEFGTDKAALKQQLDETRLPSTKANRPQRTKSAYQPRVSDDPLAPIDEPVPDPFGDAAANPPVISRVERAERGLLMAMIKSPAVMNQVKSIAGFAFVHPDYQLLLMLVDVYQAEYGADFDLAQFMDFIQKPELNQKLLAMDQEFGGFTIAQEAIQDYLRIIMTEAPLDAAVDRLTQAIRLAKQQHDDRKLVELTTELINLKRQMQTK